jgi:nucleotide-binding universal stress UspA family protein
MLRKIMVGYRRDRHGDDALALARMLASSAAVEEVLVVEGLRAGAADAGVRRAEGRLASTEEGWPQHVRVATRATPAASAADTLAALAEAERADVVVLGSTHRGFAGRVLNRTTAGSLLKGSSCTVSIAPPDLSDSPATLRRIGVAVDGSDGSRVALDWAADLATSCSASLRLIGVVAPPAPPVETWGEAVPAEAWASGLAVSENDEIVDIIRDRVHRDLVAAAESVGRTDAHTRTVVGDTATALRREAEDVDMLVVGSHGRGAVAGAVLGSVSRALSHSCPVPLVVVRA